MCESAHNHTPMETRRDEFLGSLRARKCSSATIQAYRVGLANFEQRVGEGCIVQNHAGGVVNITREDLEQYRKHLADGDYTAATRYHYLRCVRAFFAWLEEQHHIFINPAAGLRLAKPERKLGHVPSESEINRLLSKPDVFTARGLRDRAWLEVAYSTGCRLSEMICMDLFDPDSKQGCVRVRGKGNKERVVPLGRQAVDWLGRYLQHSRPKLIRNNPDELALWLGWHGKRIHYLVIERAVKTYGEQIGCSITPHSLRRACATHMLTNGAHPVQIQMLLGHRSLRTLGQYLRISITDLKAMHQRSKPGR